jgi:hypothetical protein
VWKRLRTWDFLIELEWTLDFGNVIRISSLEDR